MMIYLFGRKDTSEVAVYQYTMYEHNYFLKLQVGVFVWLWSFELE
jgi:hypothetical protein